MVANTQLDVRAQSYSRIILPLARQEKSLLYDRVFIKTDIEGKSFYQDQIGNLEMKKKTSPNADTPQNDPNLARTRVDIETFNDCYNRLIKIGDENLSPFVNNLQQGNLHIIEVLFNKYLNRCKSLNESLSKEYELGAAQARYENNEYWKDILKEERAIVTEYEGTTRDTIEEFVTIKGIPLKLVDTAGIRNAKD